MRTAVEVLRGSQVARRGALTRSTGVVLAGILLALACAWSAAAEPGASPAEPSIYSRDGAYMGGRGVYGISYFATEEPPNNSVVEDGWGFGLNAGYRAFGFLAGELDLEIMDPGFKVDGVTLRNFGMTLYAKAYPLALLPARGNWLDRFQPYIKAGPGFQLFYAEEASNKVGFVARFGGGTEFYLNSQLALTFDAAYVVTTGPISGFNSWGLGVVGLQWRFSSK